MLRPSLAKNLTLKAFVLPRICEECSLRRGIALLAAQQRANLRKRRQGRRLARSDHIWRLAEIVPHERFYVRFDNEVRLRAPREVTVPLDDVEGAAEDVCEGARLFTVARFQVNGDNHIRAEKQHAFNWHRCGQKSVHQSASLK